jgi:hypothetical protein
VGQIVPLQTKSSQAARLPLQRHSHAAARQRGSPGSPIPATTDHRSLFTDQLGIRVSRPRPRRWLRPWSGSCPWSSSCSRRWCGRSGSRWRWRWTWRPTACGYVVHTQPRCQGCLVARERRELNQIVLGAAGCLQAVVVARPVDRRQRIRAFAQ